MKNNKKKVIISALLAISMCFSLIAGATYALFTSEAKVNIAVTAATVKVTAEVDESSIKLSSMGKEQTATDADGKTLFENGGTVFYDTDTAELTLSNVTPGDEVTFNLVVTNKSNVKTQYRIRWSVEGELKEALVATADGKKIENGVSDWTALDIPANEGETITVVPVSVELPLNAGDKYQGKEASILFTVEAVQGNGTDVFGSDVGFVTEEKSLADILSEAEAGKPLYIVLNKDAEWVTLGSGGGAADVTAASEVVIDGQGYTLTATGSGVTPIGDKEAPFTLKNIKVVDESVSYAEGAWEFTYLEFGGKAFNCENVEFADPIMVEGESASFKNCSFNSDKDSEYSAWVSNGTASFVDCTFTGTRGIKMHEDYGSEIKNVTITNNAFVEISKKPGIAIGTLNADTTVVIKNNEFIGTQAGDQGLYSYETDTEVTTFTFVYENNKIVSNSDSLPAGLYKDVDNPSVYYVTAGTGLYNGISKLSDGDTLILYKDVELGNNQLAVEKAITLDLNGKDLDTANNWGGMTLKNGASIKNGTINHTGNTAAIKAFQIGSIENVTINVTPTDGKVKGGIVIQSGAGEAETYIESLKNVTITGTTNGIETYNCGDTGRAKPVIGSMENVVIDATDTGILLCAPIGTASNCDIKGGRYGINMHLKGEYTVEIDLANCTVTGGEAGIWAHDEKGISNTKNCSLSLNYDAATVINKGTAGDLVWDFEYECLNVVKLNGVKVGAFISSADELLAFAKMVNEEGKDFDNITVCLTDDIDLAGIEWTPIGAGATTFKGIFDGQGHTISNLSVTHSSKAGLFGTARGTVKNVNVNNATVVGNHYAAGIVAYGLCTRVENCNVTNSTITTSAEELNGSWDNGDKAGAIVGYLSAQPTAYVKGCTVDNVTVTGYRDIGGIVGYADGEVADNTITNSTIVCDKTHNYKNYTSNDEFDIGKVVGESTAKAVSLDTTNTATDVTVK